MSTLVFLFADGVAALLVARLLSGVAAYPDRSRPGNETEVPARSSTVGLRSGIPSRRCRVSAR
jgi:hypothetical protein